MEFYSFALRVGAALLMGCVIGLERQFRQHPAGLRSNALVCTGAALFVTLSGLLQEKSEPTRMAAYIISGIGFLGGGVILREGLNVRGMSTAATLWCTAAIGVLCGSGFPLHALLGAAAVLGTHLTLRPIARRIDDWTKLATDVETVYHLRVGCDEQHEGLIRTILLRHVNSHAKMMIQGISSEEAKDHGGAVVVADILSREQQDKALQEIMNRLNIEPSVRSVSWKKGQRQPD